MHDTLPEYNPSEYPKLLQPILDDQAAYRIVPRRRERQAEDDDDPSVFRLVVASVDSRVGAGSGGRLRDHLRFRVVGFRVLGRRGYYPQ